MFIFIDCELSMIIYSTFNAVIFRNLFPCSKCDKSFRTNYHLKVHVVAQHIQATGSIGCSLCRRKFPSVEALEEHRKSHDEDKQFICTVCTKGKRDFGRFSKIFVFPFQKSNFPQIIFQDFQHHPDWNCIRKATRKNHRVFAQPVENYISTWGEY